MPNPFLTSFLCELLISETARPIHSLAAALGTSESTLFRLVGSARRILEAHDLELASLYGKGFLVRGSVEKKKELADELLKGNTWVRLGPEEKRCVLLIELAMASGTVKLAGLGRTLSSCDSGVSRAIDVLNGELACLGVAIDRRRGFGTLLRGDEWDIRKAVLSVALRCLDENEYVGRVLESASGIDGSRSRAATFTSALFEKLAPPDEHGRTFRRIMEIEKSGDSVFTDQGLLVVSVAVAIAAMRRRNRFELPAPSRRPADGGSLHSRLDCLFAEVGDPAQREREALHLADLIRDNDLLKDTDVRADDAEKAARLLSCIESRTGLGVVREAREEAMAAGGARVRALRRRGPDSLPLDARRDAGRNVPPEAWNGLVNGIVTDAPALLGRAVTAAEAEYALDGVLPYFTRVLRRVRAVVVCASGIGVSYMLAEKIQAAIPELEVVDRLSFRALDDAYIEANGIDLVLSTIDIGKLRAPVARVDLPLRPDNIETIQRMMEGCARGSR